MKDVKQITIRLNSLIQRSSGFTREEMCNQLASVFNCAPATVSLFMSYLREYSIVDKMDDEWGFPISPVHYSRVQNALNEYHKDQNKLRKAYRKRKSNDTTPILTTLAQVAQLAGYSIKSIELCKL